MISAARCAAQKGVAAFTNVMLVCFVAALPAGERADALAAARALWSKNAPKSYSYVVVTSSTLVTQCRNAELERILSSLVRVTVREGNPVQLATLAGQEVSGSCLAFTYTIDEIFDYIEDSRRTPADWDCLDVSYDATFGFPTHVDQKCELDGDTPITVREFRPLR